MKAIQLILVCLFLAFFMLPGLVFPRVLFMGGLIEMKQDDKPAEPDQKKLELGLKVAVEVLNVARKSPQPVKQALGLTLSVKWPYRSIWEGMCPSAKIYDFIIEHNGQPIWQWSGDRMFAQVMTPVRIPGGKVVEYSVNWEFLPDQIKEEGTYTVTATFIASGQSMSKDFEIKFVHQHP